MRLRPCRRRRRNSAPGRGRNRGPATRPSRAWTPAGWRTGGPGVVRRPARCCPVRDPRATTGRSSCAGHRQNLFSPATDPDRTDTADHVCAYREGPRAAEGGSRRDVEARTVVREVGPAAGKHRRKVEPEGAAEGPGVCTCSETEATVAVTRGERAIGSGIARGRCGGRRPAAGCRGRGSASAGREGRPAGRG